MTGYVNDPLPQLRQMRDDGVITPAEYDSALSYQAPSDAERPD